MQYREMVEYIDDLENVGSWEIVWEDDYSCVIKLVPEFRPEAEQEEVLRWYLTGMFKVISYTCDDRDELIFDPIEVLEDGFRFHVTKE